MIEFKNVFKKYKNTNVLSNISFKIETGNIVCLIGESGCGKTTTLKMINRLINPTKGHILIDGEDINNKNNEVQVSKEIYEAMDRFELDDLKELNEYDRHIEHSELTDNKLNTRIMNKPLSVEDSVIRKSSYENLMIAINLLPEIQKRRIKKYYFDEKTLKEIAKEEHCTHRAVKFSLDIAIKKLKEILKN